MKDYLIFRTKKEFEELKTDFDYLFNVWEETWDEKYNHDLLYSNYVKLKIVCLLLRSCLEYKILKNENLTTKEKPQSLEKFCNYIIHNKLAEYEDNKSNNCSKLEIYLKIETDYRESISFIINKNLDEIGRVLDNLSLPEKNNLP